MDKCSLKICLQIKQNPLQNEVGFKNWHAHGESNPGYRRERAMS